MHYFYYNILDCTPVGRTAIIDIPTDNRYFLGVYFVTHTTFIARPTRIRIHAPMQDYCVTINNSV